MVDSVDGYFEGPDHDIRWHMVDDEFNQFAIEQTDQAGTLLFGKTTYQLMEDYWPKAETMPDITKEDLVIAKMMTDLPKVVVSHHNLTPNWDNVRVITENVEAEIKELKDRPGKDIFVFGSNNLCVSLIKMGLIDEFRIMVCPVAIGDGTPLFHGIEDKLKLKLLDTKTFKNGNILLSYLP